MKPKEIADKLTDMLNNMGGAEDEKEFVDQITKYTHRTLQQKAAGLFLNCFVEWAKLKKNSMFDARNEKTVEVAALLVEFLKEKDIIIRDKVFLPFI